MAVFVVAVLLCAVRFGKYTPMRSKDKKVQICINGENQRLSKSMACC